MSEIPDDGSWAGGALPGGGVADDPVADATDPVPTAAEDTIGPVGESTDVTPDGDDGDGSDDGWAETLYDHARDDLVGEAAEQAGEQTAGGLASGLGATAEQTATAMEFGRVAGPVVGVVSDLASEPVTVDTVSKSIASNVFGTVAGTASAPVLGPLGAAAFGDVAKTTADKVIDDGRDGVSHAIDWYFRDTTPAYDPTLNHQSGGTPATTHETAEWARTTWTPTDTSEGGTPETPPETWSTQRTDGGTGAGPTGDFHGTIPAAPDPTSGTAAGTMTGTSDPSPGVPSDSWWSSPTPHADIAPHDWSVHGTTSDTGAAPTREPHHDIHHGTTHDDGGTHDADHG